MVWRDRPAADGPDGEPRDQWLLVLWVVVLWLLVPWPVASELAAPPAEVVGGSAFAVPVALVADDSVVPVVLEPALLEVAPAEELPLASLLVVAVELHAARPMAIRPPIRRAWYFFIVDSCCKSVAIMEA
jgi:hypothetical protein